MTKEQTRLSWLVSQDQVPDNPSLLIKGEVPNSHKEEVARHTAYLHTLNTLHTLTLLAMVLEDSLRGGGP